MPNLLPEGYNCKCGKWNSFSAQMYAKWYGKVIHVCKCGCKNVLNEGKVIDAIQDPPT